MMGNNNSSRKASAKTASKNKKTLNGQDPVDILQQSQLEAEMSLAALAQQKERRRAEMLAFEQQQAQRLQEEAQMNNKQQANRNKFLSHVVENEKQLEVQIARIYQEQEISRLKFSEDLLKSEAEMEEGIRSVLSNIRAHRNQQQLQELLQAEEQQSQALLAIKMEEFKNLRKTDILNEMEKQLKQDFVMSKKSKESLYTVVATDDEEKNRHIEFILQNRQKDQASLVTALLEEESWQEQAFTSLLSQRDRRTAELNADIRTIVEQLTELAGWEMQRKAHQQDITTNAMAENRLQLAELLAQLIQQQELRRKDLKNLLLEMEEQRRNQAADYWLVQYQRLMESMPNSIAQNKHHIYPVPNAPPLLDSPGALEDHNSSNSFPQPSAPDIFAESTCVICLDLSCRIIFLPCGHLCTCSKCAHTVQQCPLCRCVLLQRLKINL